MYLHEGLVIGPNFLHMDVILAIHVRLCSAVRVGYRNYRRHILEVAVCIHFDLPQSAMRMPNLEDDREASRTQLCNKRKGNIIANSGSMFVE